jgi:hypothetical protein
MKDLKELGFILLNQGLHQSTSLDDRKVKYLEWTKVDQKTSSDSLIVVRVYADNDKVIIYKGGSVKNFQMPEVLFSGNISNVDILQLVYNLVKK